MRRFQFILTVSLMLLWQVLATVGLPEHWASKSALAAEGKPKETDAHAKGTDDRSIDAEELPQIKPGKPLSLQEALRLADKRNLSLAAARTDIIKARAELESAWSKLLPVATGTLTLTHNDHADTVEMGGGIEIRKQQDLKGLLQVSMPVLNAQLWKGISLADTNVEVNEHRVEESRQALFLSVSQAYFQALTSLELIEVQRSQIKRSKRHLIIATFRHRSGTGNRLDVVRAQTELLTAREDVLKAHVSLDSARDALAILIDSSEMPMPVEISEIKPPVASEGQLISKAKKQRQDVKLSKSLEELADDQLSLSWMQFVPSLQASWQLTQQITDPSSFGSPDKSRWFIGLTLSIPIYDHTRYADLHQKRASLAKARLETEYLKKQAVLEIRKARREYENALALVATSRKKAHLANQSLELAETAYENGTGSSLDVTDARRSSRAAEIDLATKRFEAQLTLLILMRKAGEDLRSFAKKR